MWHCTCFLRLACLFTVHMGSGSSPLSCGVFLPPPLLQAFLLLVAGRVPLLLLSPASLWGISPPPPSVLRAPCPLCYISFLLLLLIIQFFSFFPGWGSICPGGYADLTQGCLWEYHVPLSSPCGLCFPMRSGRWHLAAAWEPSWFLPLTWSGNVTHGLEVWRSQSFASSQWFFLSGVSPASLQDFTLGSTLSASSF
jgi:hypothetical protein